LFLLYFFFLIGLLGSGIYLDPLGYAATNRPIVPAPGDYDDREIGGMIGKGTEVLEVLVLFCVMCVVSCLCVMSYCSTTATG
jgi:hypothetical protein